CANVAARPGMREGFSCVEKRHATVIEHDRRDADLDVLHHIEHEDTVMQLDRSAMRHACDGFSSNDIARPGVLLGLQPTPDMFPQVSRNREPLYPINRHGYEKLVYQHDVCSAFVPRLRRNCKNGVELDEDMVPMLIGHSDRDASPAHLA